MYNAILLITMSTFQFGDFTYNTSNTEGESTVTGTLVENQEQPENQNQNQIVEQDVLTSTENANPTGDTVANNSDADVPVDDNKIPGSGGRKSRKSKKVAKRKTSKKAKKGSKKGKK